MRNVTDRTSNPFGMRPPVDESRDGEPAAVFGYGDANADFHLIGDHPGVHGGETTGVPFTGSAAGLAIQDVVRRVGFVNGPTDEPTFENLFASYRHMCRLPDGRSPTDEEYATLERYFDAELRAINAHVLLPVGERATDHVLRTYTTRRSRYDLETATPHAEEIRGRGFMVVPIRDPREWDDAEGTALAESLEAIRSRDYRQTKGVATRVG